ncbi:protein kinase [Streptomyces sp. NPDC004267]|uniref:protein kinase domain-containing protein n=1 Tax=Streptomyces sp. NPDC004267 TaxID=3364694 RepID=UPI0036A60B74
MASPLLPSDPRQLGGYYLDGRLGAGGQGVVYEGYDADGARVAVKTLHEASFADRAMLRQEIRAWRLVAPFCTTKVLYDDLDGPVPFIVSEFVAGPDLRRAVDDGAPYGPEELRRLAIGVATALVAIHRAGVVHRDLKPENILLGSDGPRVIDFGIARIVEGTASAGIPMGTMRYMPPERYRGEHGDGKVDVWGWGAVVLFAATGRHAFDADSAAALTYQIASHDPDTSDLDEPLRSLVTAALAKDPADRPTSEQLLLSLVGRSDLADVVEGVPLGTRPGAAEPSRADLAEAAFTGLDTAAQEAVSQVLLRLVAPGERAEDTLRTALRTEFTDGLTPEPVLDRVLRAFTDAGILVWEDQAVTLYSAALIRAWPRLRDWVEAERAGLGLHQRLSEASRDWDGNGRKSGDLFQGTALERARDWAATGRRHLTLNRVERGFLEAAAELARRRGRLRVWLSAVLALLTVVATGGVVVAVDQWQTTVAQRDRAASAQVAGAALAVRRDDPQLGRRLAIASARLGGTTESHSALLALRNQWEDDAVRLLDFAPTYAALDATGHTLAAANGTRLEFWNVDARKRIGSYTAPARVDLVDLSDDGRTAAVRTLDGFTRLIDVPTARPRDAHAYPSRNAGTGISPHGTYLMVESIDPSSLVIWDTRTARKVITVTPRGRGISFLMLNSSFSPDESVVSLPGADPVHRFTWYDTRTGKKLPVPLPYAGLKVADTKGPVVFSPDGIHAAVLTKQGTVSVFDRAEGWTGIELKGAEVDSDYPLIFSNDGHYLVQGTVVWDATRTGIDDPVMRFSTTQSECYFHTPPRFSVSRSKLRCAGTDGVVRSLDIGFFTHPAKEAHRFQSSTVLYSNAVVSADRRTFALVDGHDIDIWSPLTRTTRFTVVTEEYVDDLRLSHDGRLLAVRMGTRIEIWDLGGRTAGKATGRGTLTVLKESDVSGTLVDFAFSPDDGSLAVQAVTADGNNTLAFWDLATRRRTFETHKDLGPAADGAAVLFAPDGKSLIAAPNFGRIAFPSGAVLAKGSSGLEVDSMSDDGTKLYSHPRGFRPVIRTLDARRLVPVGDDLRTGSVWGPLLAYENATAVSPDGRTFATVHQAGVLYQIKLWDAGSRIQLGVPMTGSHDDITALAFASDGSALTAVDREGRSVTYTLDPERLIRELCARSGGLTEEEWRAHIPDVPYRKTC